MAMRPRSAAGGAGPGTRQDTRETRIVTSPSEHQAEPRTPSELIEDVHRQLDEQQAGEDAFAAAAGSDEGQAVEVSIGDKLFQPLSYNGVRIGPFKATTVVRRGESVAQAMLRLHAEMTKAVRVIHQREADQYVADLAALVRKTEDVKL